MSVPFLFTLAMVHPNIGGCIIEFQWGFIVSDFVLAFIYSRVSKEIQVKGEGLARQLKEAQGFIASRNLERAAKGLPPYRIADNLSDQGISAYIGLNTKENAGLGAFIKAAEEGEVPRGSLLVVEAVDRISRMESDKAREIFRRLKELGIDVGIVRFQMIVKHNEPTRLDHDLLMTAGFHLAHMESEQKSQRVKATLTRNRKIADEGGRKSTSNAPKWMQISDDRMEFNLVPDRVRVIEKMIEMKLEGIGCHTIANKLNEMKIPFFIKDKQGNDREWDSNMVTRYLHMPQLYGAFQPKHRVFNEHGTEQRVNNGDLRLNYYPAIINKEKFDLLQLTFITNPDDEKKSKGGRQNGEYKNLFSDLCFCPVCGDGMHFSQPPRTKAKLLCRSHSRLNRCTQKPLYYAGFEERLIRALSGLDYARINNKGFKKLKEETALIESKIATLHKTVAFLNDQLLKCSDIRVMGSFNDKLSAVHAEIDEAEGQLTGALALQNNYNATITSDLDLTTNDGRARYNAFIKTFVRYIIAADERSGCPIRVVFKSDIVGELPFSFNDNKQNDDAVTEIFRNKKSIAESKPVRVRVSA